MKVMLCTRSLYIFDAINTFWRFIYSYTCCNEGGIMIYLYSTNYCYNATHTFLRTSNYSWWKKAFFILISRTTAVVALLRHKIKSFAWIYMYGCACVCMYRLKHKKIIGLFCSCGLSQQKRFRGLNIERHIMKLNSIWR